MPGIAKLNRGRRLPPKAPAELRRPTAMAPDQDMAKEVESDIPIRPAGELDPVAHNVAAANSQADAEAGAPAPPAQPRRRPT